MISIHEMCEKLDEIERILMAKRGLSIREAIMLGGVAAAKKALETIE